MIQDNREESALHPEVTVGGLIFNDKNELFLMKTYKWGGLFCIPGGHIELGETAEDAVLREIKEETNLDVRDIQFHCVQDCIFSKKFHERKHFVFLDFICKAVSEDVILNEEGSEYVWIDIHEIDAIPVEPYTRKTIEVFLHPDSEKYFSNKESIDG